MNKVWVLVDIYGNIEAVCETMRDFLCLMEIRQDLSEKYYIEDELQLIRITLDELEKALY